MSVPPIQVVSCLSTPPFALILALTNFFLLDPHHVTKLDLPPLVDHDLHLARDAQGRESWILNDVTKIGDEVSKLTPCAYALAE